MTSNIHSGIAILLGITTCVYSGNDTQKKIEELEKEKAHLFKEINTAIDKNLDLLNDTNDTEAILAVNYLKDLKEHITELNPSDIKDVAYTNFSEETFRRKAKNKKSPNDFMLEIEQVLKPKHVSEKKLKQILDNREIIKNKLDEWILERQKEKDRIKKSKMQVKYLERSGKYEKCPRFGYAGRKRKKKDDYASCKKKYKDRYDGKCNPNRNKTEKPVKAPSSGRKMYPCCRKCCKKSYMGCL